MAKKSAKRHGSVSANARQSATGLSDRAVQELQQAYDDGTISGATLDEVDPLNQVGDDDEDGDD